MFYYICFLTDLNNYDNSNKQIKKWNKVKGSNWGNNLVEDKMFLQKI